MKKIILITLAAATFSACDNNYKRPESLTHKFTKPLIIIGKFSGEKEPGISTYQYEDTSGYRYTFSDFTSKYSMGDTIK